MNPLFSYAMKSLWKNKARTIVTIIGIMMSAALIVALATFGTSLYNYVQEGYIDKNGDWHLGITNARVQDIEDICMETDTVNPVPAKSIGYADVRAAGFEKPYLYLQGVGQEYYEHMPVRLIEGRAPEHEGEILLPEGFRKTGAAADAARSGKYQVGDTMNLEVGLRLKEGRILWQNVPYGSDAGSMFMGTGEEELRQIQVQSYTIVGFYEEPNSGYGVERYDTPGYEALVWWDGKIAEDGYDRFSLWFQISDVGNNRFHEVYDKLRLVYGYENSQIFINLELLSLYGVRISGRGESAAVAAVVVILLFIILIGSVMLIYNAFAISVGERTKQFGLLSSVGATRKQIRRSILYEAAIVSGIGILLGILAGIAIVAAVLAAAGETVADLMEFSIMPHLYVWIPAVLLAIALAVLTVLVSAWIPAKRATKVSAIEAIRQNHEIRYSGKQRKIPEWVERLFGFEGMLAVTYSGRNRRRYRVTTFALFLSMVLFVSINAFSDYMMTVIQTEYKTSNYDVWVQFQWDQELTEKRQREIIEALRKLNSVDSVTQVTFLTYKMPFEDNESHVTEDFRRVLENASDTAKISVCVSVVDDESFSDFCREHGLEEACFLDPEDRKVIVKNHFKAVDEKSGNTKLIEGVLEKDGRFYVDLASAFYYRDDYQSDIMEFTAGYYAESLAPGCNDNWNLSVMLPKTMADALGLQETEAYTLTYFMTTSNHREAAEEAKSILQAKHPDVSVFDQAERQAGNRNLVLLLRLLSNGFIIMITIISVSNVFNTVSSSLKLRQKEFAMLKTVGMTQQGLRRMMNLECLMYGGKAVIFGLPVSLLIAAVMYYFFRKDVVFAFFLPVQSILIAIGSIFGVVFVTMLYTMGRMRKENVIDVLKQESF